MIRVTDINGREHYVAPEAVAFISEAGALGQWHGIKSIVRLFNGRVIESSDESATLAARIDAFLAGKGRE